MSTSYKPNHLLSHPSANEDIPEDTPFETIGGSGATIVRRPSLLSCVPERGLLQPSRSYTSSPSDSDGRKSSCESISRWQEDEVISWLDEIGFGEYSVCIPNALLY